MAIRRSSAIFASSIPSAASIRRTKRVGVERGEQHVLDAHATVCCSSARRSAARPISSAPYGDDRPNRAPGGIGMKVLVTVWDGGPNDALED